MCSLFALLSTIFKYQAYSYAHETWIRPRQFANVWDHTAHFLLMNASNLPLPRPAVGLLVKAELRMTANKGIGVFAKEFIPANTRLFNTNETHYNEQEAIAYLDSLPSDEHRKYWLEHAYGHYGMIAATDGDDEMVNHSSNPNIAEGDDGYEYSIRDIHEGEELTQDYTTYEDLEVPFYIKLCEKYGVPTSVEGFVDD